MEVLVTGGAGYVGSVVAEELLKEGFGVIVLDNLQEGHHDAVPEGAEFMVADITVRQELEKVFAQNRIDAVMHMAAETVVPVSMTDTTRHFRCNVVGGLNLLDAMLEHDVRRLIFSSSAAVYGEPQADEIGEDHPKVPLNPYGETKLIFERILEWYGRAYQLKFICLRYFNAAGASRRLGEDHQPETHLIPNVLRAALDRSAPVTLFGTDYPTRDGSCVRDYVHVIDIARAHILALKRLEDRSGRAYNLGSGGGHSVIEVVEVARQVTGVDIPAKVSARRPGDPAVLVASSALARQELGWKPEYEGLEGIVSSSWRWMKEHPRGYSR
ncbi:MAG TPA: UDP-glucose 4-epimerase GalE [Dehalococcoidia bacterium]|nr:UDP-glucose 4-epimerase GalE [Dehalococcoidia bacterium]